MIANHFKKIVTASVRYLVDDMDAAIAFYTGLIGFDVVINKSPYFAWLSLGNLRLLLSHPGGGSGGGEAMPDGALPTPGGWNRISLEVNDLEATVQDLKNQDAHFRNEVVTGIGGKQILLEDPSGNLVELFQPF